MNIFRNQQPRSKLTRYEWAEKIILQGKPRGIKPHNVSKSFVGCAVKDNINGENICKLRVGGQLEFKVFTTDNIELIAHA